MRIHDLEAAEWREAPGGYHRKSIASDVALLDIAHDVELQSNGSGRHLIVVLNGAGQVAAGSRGAFLGGGICLGVDPSERVMMRPDAEKGLLLLQVRLSDEAAESLFEEVPERTDTWEIEPQPPASPAPEAPAEAAEAPVEEAEAPLEEAEAPEAEEAGGEWEEDDGDEYDESREAAAAAPALVDVEAFTEARAARTESDGAAADGGEDDDGVEFDADEEDEAEGEEARQDEVDGAEDGVWEVAEMEPQAEAEEPIAEERVLAAAAAHASADTQASSDAQASSDTPSFGSNRTDGGLGSLPRGLIHRAESGELVLNGRALRAGQTLSVYHRRRWAQARVLGENGRWYVVVASQHVPLVPGMRARQEY